MKKKIEWIVLLGIITSAFWLSACKEDSETPLNPPPTQGPKAALTGEKTILQMNGANSGTATLAQRADGSTLVTIQISDAPGIHPSHIHDSRDRILFDLTNVVGGGPIETDVPADKIMYDNLINLRGGYIAVHASSSDFTLIARADF